MQIRLLTVFLPLWLDIAAPIPPFRFPFPGRNFFALAGWWPIPMWVAPRQSPAVPASCTTVAAAPGRRPAGKLFVVAEGSAGPGTGIQLIGNHLAP